MNSKMRNEILKVGKNVGRFAPESMESKNFEAIPYGDDTIVITPEGYLLLLPEQRHEPSSIDIMRARLVQEKRLQDREDEEREERESEASQPGRLVGHLFAPNSFISKILEMDVIDGEQSTTSRKQKKDRKHH